MSDSLRGRLIVATPALGDPNFSHTVVLLLDHNEQGALGIVLNRPSGVEVADTIPRWESLAAKPKVMFVGGPVQPEAVVALCPAEEDREEVSVVAPGIGIVDLRSDPLSLIGDVRGLRLFAGYAGWGDGQLEDEIEQGGWFLVEPRANDISRPDPEGLWVEVLARQGGVFKTITEDPSLN